MKRLSGPEADAALAWLADRPREEAVTGYAPEGWDGHTWILHALYENPSLRGLGSHDDLHRRRLDAGDVAPLVIGDVNVDENTTVTGTPLGFVIRPGSEWRRLTWSDYLGRFPEFAPNREFPPSFQWFPKGSWPVAVEAPPEGSMDEVSFDALLTVLSNVSGASAECFAFFASLPAGDFDEPHVWSAQLADLPALVEENGGDYGSTPTNIWPADRSWFVWTDWDLQGTRVQGRMPLIDRLKGTDALETSDWP